jgi:SAM-dependent methyltransferase
MSNPSRDEFPDHFSKIASSYVQYRPRYPAALADFLSGIAPARELAWECGCGSGQLSVDLANRFARVIATDASADQLAQAVPHPRIEYRCATAERSGLSSGIADAVIAAQAAHWFDLQSWYGEVRRVAKPAAIVAAISYGNVLMEGDAGALVERFYGGLVGTYWSPHRKLVDEGYRDLFFPFEEIEAPPLEIRVEWDLAAFQGYVETWSAVRALVQAEGRSRLESFREELARAWGPAQETRTVRWPIAVRAGRV